MGTERRVHSEEYKIEAVRRIEKGKESITEIASQLGIDRSLLKKWQTKLRAAESAGAAPTVSLHEEIRRLRRENADLREDREILKKAVTFFVKPPR